VGQGKRVSCHVGGKGEMRYTDAVSHKHLTAYTRVPESFWYRGPLEKCH
jgi:hypothetical protein